MLKETFIELLTKYTDNNSLVNILWVEIEEAYSDKKRYYHTLTHLDNLLRQLTLVKTEIKNWDTILFSLFYHDFVYNSLNSDNEEKSAEIAEKRMIQVSIPHPIIEVSKNQILATKSHTSETDKDASYFIDADLSILGQNENRYKEYLKSIRMEFLFFPSVVYNEGRKKVLNHFLKMDRIFKTEYFYTKFENQARVNIKNELESLNRIRNKFFLETTKQWNFNIEEDGDLYEFFHNGVEMLENTEGVEKITYYPGFFDSGYYRFYYKKVKLNIEYEGMLGIDLRTEPNPTESDLKVANEIYELLKAVRNKNHS